jgi:hypothetical protein
MNKEFIIIDSEAYYKLLQETIEYVKHHTKPQESYWMTPEQVKALLNIGTSTLQKLRNNGQIVYTQISKKTIHYERKSVMEYLQKHIVR